MQAIWDILNQIGTAIADIWNFIQSGFHYLGIALDFILNGINYAYDFISTFPEFLKAFAIACILITAVYTVLGWAGGNSE